MTPKITSTPADGRTLRLYRARYHLGPALVTAGAGRHPATKQDDDKDPKGQESVLELRVLLVDSHPEIWRQLEVRASTCLGQVHGVLQVAFGWEDAHLHRFTDSDPFAPMRPSDGEIPEALQWLPKQWCREPVDLVEEDYSLDQLLARGSGMAFYEYDFGDSWLHRIELISRHPAPWTAPPARLVDGARRGPLEDSGGMPGFEEILDALADPAHPEHLEHSTWVAESIGTDEPFDPSYLDVEAINRELVFVLQRRPGPSTKTDRSGNRTYRSESYS